MKFAYSIAVLLLFCCSVVADEKPRFVSIATWNVEWFYDSYTGNNRSDLSKEQSSPSRDEWDWKLGQVARVIAKANPTILALQEVENREVARQLTKLLADQYKLKYRIAYIQGWDNFTEQDVAVIYQGGLVEYSCREQSSEQFRSRNFYNLNKHLFAKFEWGKGNDKESLLLLNVHLRAMPEKHDLRQKQCKLIREWINESVADGENVVVLGDFNTEQLSDSIAPNSDLAILSGWKTQTKSDDLFDLHPFVPKASRATHLSGKQFDRILVSQPLLQDQGNAKDLVFSRISTFKDQVVVGEQDRDHFNQFYKISRQERDISDHYPVMAIFEFK